jgi:hypothetical protein
MLRYLLILTVSLLTFLVVSDIFSPFGCSGPPIV